MTLLNRADALFLGDRPASAAFLGDDLVWPEHENRFFNALLRTNPIAFWPLNETRGTVAHELIMGRHGEYVGPCQLGVGGPVGEPAVSFAGNTTANPAWVRVRNSFNFVPVNNFTVAAWTFYPVTGNSFTVGGVLGNNGAAPWVWHQIGTERRRIFLGDGSQGSDGTLDRITDLDLIGPSAGQWNWIVFKFGNPITPGGGRGMMWHRNGSGAPPNYLPSWGPGNVATPMAVASGTLGWGATVNPSGTVVAPPGQAANRAVWTGRLAGCTIWNRLLSGEEIANLWAAR